MNVRIFGDEFDKPLEAIKEISCKTEHNLYDLIIFVGFHNLSTVILKDNSNELYKGDQKSSEGDRSEMVSEHPVESSC